MSTENFKLPEIPGTEIKDLTPDLQDKFITGLELFRKETEFIPMLVDALIPKVAVWAIVGASDTGKSMILRQLAMNVAAGQSFIDRQVFTEHNRVIVVCSEDDDFAISYLIRKQNKSIGLTDESFQNMEFLFDTSDLVETLNAKLESNPADLVIIDAFSDVFDGKDGNQNSQVRQFLNKYSQLANKHKCSIGFLHHTGKRTEDLAPSKNNAIGSQGFEAKMRLVIEMRLDKVNPDLRHFCIVKGNYLPQAEKNSSIVLKMDENLTFTNTGERVSFEKLNGDAKGKSEKIEPSKMGDDQHFNCIRSLMSNGKIYSRKDVSEALQGYWDISERISRRFITYYDTQRWIVDVSTNPKVRKYSNNLPT